MLIAFECKSAGLNNLLYIVKQFMDVIMIIAPILTIISFTLLFVQMAMKPEEKKLIGKLKNATLALILVFLTPLIVNISMGVIGDKTEISYCYNKATKSSTNPSYIATRDEKGKNSVLTKKEEYEKGEPKQLDFSCKSSKINANFSCETIRIVEHHMNDLNYYNYYDVINRYGGFKNYTKSLGGIFADYYGEKQYVTKVYELQRVSEYVFGYMTMFGFDYFNGRNLKYCKWGGGCLVYDDLNKAIAEGKAYTITYPTGTEDAFYPGQFRYEDYGLSDSEHFDNIISAKSGLNMTTNCNFAVDMVYFKAGIFGTGRTGTDGSCNYKTLYRTCKKVIYKSKDLEVGDILAFFNDPIPVGSNPSVWPDSWYHAAFVGETHKQDGYVVIYDGGSRFTSGRNHKWKMSTKDTGVNSWVGFRVVELD